MTDLSRLMAAMVALHDSKPGQPSIVARYAAFEELRALGWAALSPASATAVRSIGHQLDTFRLDEPDLGWAPLWQAFEDLEDAVIRS